MFLKKFYTSIFLILIIGSLSVLLMSCTVEDYRTKIFYPIKNDRISPDDLISNGFSRVPVDVPMYYATQGDTSWTYTFTYDLSQVFSSSWVIENQEMDSLWLANFFLKHKLDLFKVDDLLNQTEFDGPRVYVRQYDVNQIFELQRDSNKLYIFYNHRYDASEN